MNSQGANEKRVKCLAVPVERFNSYVRLGRNLLSLLNGRRL